MTAAPRMRPFWRRWLLIPSLALMGLNLVLLLAYTLPRTLQERSIESRREALRAELERERRLAADAERRAETLRSNARDADRFLREVVGTRGARLVPAVQEIEAAANELGLRTRQWTYQPQEVKEAGLIRFGVTMPLAGSYQQLVSFLDRLERSPQFLTVDQVQLTERRGEGGASLSLVFSAYFRAESGGGRGR